jgi:hypothetical protein
LSRIRAKIRAFIKRQNETLDIERIGLICEALPRSLIGYRIAVVADLHLRKITAFHQKIIDALVAIRPGCILIAGDSTDERTPDASTLVPFFSRMARIAPTVAVLGNNDCDTLRTPALRDLYRACSITLLENETRYIDARGFPMRITGLTDPTAFRFGVHVEREAAPGAPLSRVKIETALSSDSTEKEWVPPILLLHQPQLALPYAKMGASLIFAGHTHGGQFRLPLIGGLYAPNQGIFPQYTGGVYPLGVSRMVVSRGLGNHSFPFRLFNYPHLPYIEFVESAK